MFNRILEEAVKNKLHKGKTIIVFGPRQVGKTTLIQKVVGDKTHLFLDADDPEARLLLTRPNTEDLRTLIGSYNLVFIDEAQRIEDVGLTLKIIHDQFKDVQLIVSGSSAFELSNQTSEPLTGRKWEYKMYPVSWEELESHVGFLTATRQLEQRLIYGSYPDVLNNPGDERSILTTLSGDYLYKDILAFAGIRKPDILDKIVRALALQVGHEVSYNEVAQLVGVDKNTVSSYIDLLEKSYVIFSLPSFSRNLRNEIKTNRKIYFVDNGIRNAVIQNFSPLEFRQDVGPLWENFLISERMKYKAYHQHYAHSYFWRTTDQKEVDYVEDIDGQIYGFEFKWNPKSKGKPPRQFEATYQAKVKIISPENFRDFVMVGK
jgi:uncharacterized protein